MDILAISVNHGTTAYVDLMITTLLEVDRSAGVELLVLDNGSDDLAQLDWAVERGVTIESSGYGTERSVTTHGEILRDAVLAHPEPTAYLLLDADCFFVEPGTVDTMRAELSADDGLFAVQARQCDEDGTDLEQPFRPWTREIEQRVRELPDGDWWDPDRIPVTLGDRVHPFCTLIRNTPTVRRAVELIGLSPALTQCERGGRWWDTLGLFTQVMRTHGLDWTYSARSAGHFGNVSWSTEWSQRKAERRDRLRAGVARHPGAGLARHADPSPTPQ